jgi:OOP family OmpA-OmpF porin
MRRTALGLLSIPSLLAVACATPVVQPVAVQPVAPSRGETVVVDQSITLVDSSGSISRREQFPKEKAMVQSLVSAMPEGRYEAGAIAFGGVNREAQPLAPFDRRSLSSHANELRYLSEGTPIDQVILEAGEQLKGKKGQAAITLISDGLPTDVGGREVPPERAIDAAKAVDGAYDGDLCFHTVQIGDEPAGTQFLQDLSKVTGCGSYRSASSLNSAAALQAFQRDVYLGGAPVVAAVDGDDDEDGVLNSKDACPRTPKLARVDARGCWVIANLHFDTDSSTIHPDDAELLQSRGVAILEANPDLRVRIDGHTDSRGSDAYNQQLSERRAQAVHKFFVDRGIDPGRLETRGFGESQPAVANDTPEHMAENRRVEFTPL